MRSPDEALAWLADEAADPSQDWYNACEKLCRMAYGLPAHYYSADDHAVAIPGGHRFGTEPPSRGDLALYRNSSYGHITVFTGRGWECYSNDYGGRGTVALCDARDLVSWCGAYAGYVANAWWSSSNYIETHGGEMALSDDDVRRVAEAVLDADVEPTGWAEDVYKAEGWGKPSAKPLGALVYNTATRLQRLEESG